MAYEKSMEAERGAEVHGEDERKEEMVRDEQGRVEKRNSDDRP